MKKMIGMFTAALALLVIGCNQEGRPTGEFGLSRLKAGVSDEAEVRQVMGKPEAVFEEEDGTRILEYPKGPEGARTWMFRINEDGRLHSYHQVLTEENFAKIQPGMSREEVRWLLGKPRRIMPFKRLNEEVWDWRYLSVNPAVRLFNVHFDLQTGKVRRTSTSDDLSRQGGG